MRRNDVGAAVLVLAEIDFVFFLTEEGCQLSRGISCIFTESKTTPTVHTVHRPHKRVSEDEKRVVGRRDAQKTQRLVIVPKYVWLKLEDEILIRNANR